MLLERSSVRAMVWFLWHVARDKVRIFFSMDFNGGTGRLLIFEGMIGLRPCIRVLKAADLLDT